MNVLCQNTFSLSHLLDQIRSLSVLQQQEEILRLHCQVRKLNCDLKAKIRKEAKDKDRTQANDSRLIILNFSQEKDGKLEKVTKKLKKINGLC